MNQYGFLSELIDEATPSLESNGDIDVIATPTLDNRPSISGPNNKATPPFTIRFSNQIYRVYFNAGTDLNDPSASNYFCRFLDTRNSHAIVHLYLGAGWCMDEVAISTIIGAILSAQCTVRGIASGPCSTAETYIFCCCKEHEIRKFAHLEFSVNSADKKYRTEWQHIKKYILDRAVQHGFLTTEAIDEMVKYNDTLVLYPDDIQTSSTDS